MKFKHRLGLVQSEKAHLLSRIGQLMEQGYSLFQTLEIIRASSPEKQRFWLDKILTSLEQGKSIEDGFRLASFSEHVSIMIAQAEWHGNITLAFKQAASWKERKLEIKRQWQRILTYPIILLIILSSILYLIFNWVIPQFLVMFTAFNVEIPDITLKTILFFEWWNDVYPSLAGIISAGLIIGYLGWRNPGSRQQLIRLLLKIPWLRKLVQDYYTIIFSLQLGSFLQANLPLNVSLHKVIESCNSHSLKAGLARMEKKILEGHNVAYVVQQEHLFSAELYPIVYYAEKKGLLGQQLVQYGILLETEVLAAWLRRIKIAEPVLLVGIGFFIAYLFYALFTPVLELITVI